MNTIVKNLKSISSFFVLIIISWLLIHALAVFGVFIAIAYPVWWLTSSRKLICLLCKTKKVGEDCSFCQQVVSVEGGARPKTLLSAFFNAFLIFLISIFSIGLIYGESQLLLRLGFFPAAKTVSFSAPVTKEYELGTIFQLKLELVGIKEPINTVRVDLEYDPTHLEIMDISTKDSFSTIFIQKEINNKAGYARIAGGLPSPGFFKEKGTFATVYLRSIKVGITTVKFLPTSLVLANNGRGDNVLSEFNSVSYLIVPRRPVQDESSKTLSLGSNILGESTGSAQLIFYDEKEVFEADIDNYQEISIDKNASLPRKFLKKIGEFDIFLLSQWMRVF